MLLGYDALGRPVLGQISVPAAPATFAPTPFSNWSVPRKAIAVAVIATSVHGFVAPPSAQAAPPFSKFSAPQRKPLQQAPWDFVPPRSVVPTAVFTKFSQPQPRVNLPAELPSALFEVAASPVVTIAFSPFALPIISKPVIADQPLALFEVEPPVTPPFTGFARFEQVVRPKSISVLYSAFQPAQLFVPVPDTHDLVFLGDQFRKRTDVIDEELSRKGRLRRDLEQAVYGPEVVYLPPAAETPNAKAAPPNVEELARAVMAAREAQAKTQRAEIEQDDEAVIEMILRDL